jgi:ABC-2 type transport system ATP-binding protein
MLDSFAPTSSPRPALADEPAPIIRVRGLSKRYAASLPDARGNMIASAGLGLWARNIRRALVSAPAHEVQALAGIDLDVRPGEVFGLLGRNGAGKTTLVKILAGLVAPSSGEAIVCGASVGERPDLVKRSVSYVSTTGWMGLEWQLSVRENLRLYAHLFGLGGDQANDRVERALADVGLTEHAGKGVHQLSHGMRQRLVLARGLLVRTPLVYLDEPTVGLDPVTAADVRRLIKEKINHERGQTVLLTGHYIPELEELCDRLAVIHSGRIVAVGTPAELRATVAERRVVTLRATGWSDAVRDRVGELNGVLAVSVLAHDLAAETALAHVHCRRDEPDLQALIDALRSVGVRVVFASEEEPTLEDSFLALTGGEAR